MAPVPNVIIVDSRDDSRYVYVIVEPACKVPVLKVKLNDECYVMTLIDNKCHLNLDLSDCKGK